MRIVILSQVYVPDPASVGQHIHDFAAAMAARGHEVRAFCSSRGYEDSSARYPRREWRDGVTIRRYALPLFSKANMLVRVLGSAWAQAALFFDVLLSRRPDVIFFSTSPPLVGVTATIAAKLKRLFGAQAALAYWAMDLNPDQLLAMNKLRRGSLTHRLLEAANRFVLRNADLTVALDRFMDARLHDGARRPHAVVVLPPWPHEDADEPPLPHAANDFRVGHGLQDKFVVMYSGNHSPANPLATLLAATRAFADDDSIRFLFVGGGTGKAAVDGLIRTHRPPNVVSLPYQPLATLRQSLSAADLHVVSLGTEMVGVIHPCKVYGAMAVGRPILYFGPRPSHVTDLIDAAQIGTPVAHGDVEGAVAAIRALRDLPASDRAAMGLRAQAMLRSSLSRRIVGGALCDAVERIAAPRPPDAASAGA